MKTVLYYDGAPANHEDKAITKLENRGFKVVHYDAGVDKEENWHGANKTFQMYERLLNQTEGFDYLYFATNMQFAQFLYDLKTRPQMKTKIILLNTLRGMDRSYQKCLCFKELLDMPQVQRVVIHSMITEDFVWPENIIQADVNTDKIKLMPEPFDDIQENLEVFQTKSKEEARRHFWIPQDAYLVTWTGTWSQIRGPDIFVEALKYVKPDIKILIHRHFVGFDESLPSNLIDIAFENHPNTILIERRLTREEYPAIYLASDVIVCTHRKSYAYAISGLPALAFKAKVPIVVPDIYTFNEVANRFGVGLVYEAENPKSLGETINRIKETEMKDARFDDALKGKEDWTDTSVVAFEGIES
jgi:glycosyltransferase involved in cell wall biosynthesis